MGSARFPAFRWKRQRVALVNAAAGTVAAQYEYGPFGELLRATGPMAKANPFRFSTKYQDEETDLLYYGYRYYNAGTGRWLSRDPIGEKGGPNDYASLANSLPNGVDPDGRRLWPFGSGGCKDPCAWARKRDRKNVGVTVCCNGQKYACVLRPGGATDAKNPNAMQVISICVLEHEKRHVIDPNLPCPSCKGPTWAEYDYAWTKLHGECDAYTAEMMCLQQNAYRCGQDSDCIKQVEAEMKNVQAHINQNCD